jgi:shikimate kinase
MAGTGLPVIALVGLMGAGKSEVARALAERMGAAVADLDAMTEAESGRTISELFAREGEDAFRRLEGRLLEQALASGAGVIACGGGIVLDPAYRNALRSRCLVVWLEVTPGTAARRLAGHEHARPLLAGTDPERRLADLLAARRPLYEEVAALRVVTEGRTAEQVADEVLRRVRGMD